MKYKWKGTCKMNKKFLIVLYFIGLTAGIICFNYMIFTISDLTDYLSEILFDIHKLEYIDKKQLFLYVFLKRVNQMFMLSFFSISISQQLVVSVVIGYFASITGFYLSACTFYYGIKGVFTGLFFLLSPSLLVALLIFVNIKINDNKKDKTIKSRLYMCLALIIATIMVSIVEITVNNWIICKF